MAARTTSNEGAGGNAGKGRGNGPDPAESATQSIEELEERYQHLSQEKVRAETNRENAQKRLDDLKREAKERYGTDDIEELRRKLAEMKQENERKKAEYQQHLNTIETELANVEERFAEGSQ